jgi:hypothetical protein
MMTHRGILTPNLLNLTRKSGKTRGNKGLEMYISELKIIYV